MMKKTLSILLALCMAFSLLPTLALAADGEEPTEICSGTCGDTATFVLTTDGTVTISGTGTVAVYYEWNVTSGNLDEDADTRITKIVISEGITAIGDSAFAGWDVEELILPNSLETIGRDAFYRCLQLADITWGNGLKTIGELAFGSCAALKELNLPASLESIGTDAFHSCTELEYAIIYGDVGAGAFDTCLALKEAYVMNAKVVSRYVFHTCLNLEYVYLADTIESLGQGAFAGCSSLKWVRVPAKVTELPKIVFSSCSSLEYLIVPGITFIDAGCFGGCESLTEIYYGGTEEQINKMQYDAEGNELLENVTWYLMPGMPDAIYGFYDMPDENEWSYEGIAYCLDAGLMNGMGDGYFQPNGTTTRAQLVTILWRMCEEPAAEKAADFIDTQDHWAKNAISWAAENGIVNGVGEGLFAPDAPITREQLVTIFHRFCKEYLEMDVSQTQALDSFPDAGSVSDWAQDAMQWGVAVKLISGVATQGGAILQPQGSATRAQIAKVILNFFENVYTE